MKIRQPAINTKRIINISHIEHVSNGFISYLNQDCCEPFRFVIKDYGGDSIQGFIIIKKLRDWLLGNDSDELIERLAELAHLCDICEKNDIDEVIFS